MAPPGQPLDPLDQKVVDDVAEHGWSAMSVGAGGGQPNFTYSIGFWETLDAPEVIVFGLPSKLQHSMLWEVFRQIKAGLVLEQNIRIGNVLEGFDCIVQPVHETHVGTYFGFALWYCRHKQRPDSLTAYQLFWPGVVGGLFPWEPQCHEDVRDGQPLLYLPRGLPLN